MSRFDDRLTKELERVARPAEPTGVFDEIDRRRERRVTVRRMQTAMLAVAVFAGSIGGVLVLNRAFRGEGISTPAVTPARNGPIVVSFGDDGGIHLYLLDPNDPTWDPSQHRLTNEVSKDTQPAISPDGRMVAFVRENLQHGGLTVWTMSIDGSDPRQISPSDWNANYPVWSPDGKQIAYIGGNGEDIAVYIVSVDGNLDLRRLTSDTLGGVKVGLAWSPDATQIAVAIANGTGGSHISLIDLGSDSASVATETFWDVGAPSWSPDGRYLAYAHGGGIVTLELENAKVRELTPVEAPVFAPGSDPRRFDSDPTWSPDGEWIAFERFFSPSEFFVYAIRPDGTELHRIGTGGDPAWAVAQPTPEPSGTVIKPTATLLVSSHGPSGDAALLHGTIAVANGCVGVGAGDTFTYLVWPAGYSLVTLDGALTVVDGSGTVGSIGDTIRMGGGIFSLTRAEEAVVGGIPDACREPGENYWYVGRVEQESSSAPSGSKDLIPGLTGKICNMASSVAGFGRADPGTAYTFERQPGDHPGCLEAGHGKAYVAIALEGARYSASTGPLSPCDPVCAVIGTVDLNGDGVDEVLVGTRLYYPTSPVAVQVFAVTSPPSGSPHLVAVVRDDGAPLIVSWGSGGAGTWDDGVTCSRTPVPTFTHWRGTSPDAGTTWNWRKTVYSLDVGADQVVARTISSEQTTTINPDGPKLHMMCGEDIVAG